MESRLSWKILRVTASAWILASTLLVPGCASSGSHQTTDISTPIGGIKIKTQAGQFHVTLAAGQHGKITFKDADGNTIPGGIEADGPIDQDFPLPEGYASYDYTVTDKKREEEARNDLAVPAPVPLNWWQVNCTSNFLDDSSLHGFTYQITTRADSEGRAWNAFHATMAAGPGGVVPGGVQVDAWVDVQAGLSSTSITSALRDNFASYVITVDGTVVADLSTGTNATLTTLGNGWKSVTSTLPNTLAGSGATVLLAQKGSAAGAATALLEIGKL